MNKMDIKRLLLFFLNNSTRELGRTELMKYVYLFEYYYFQMFGKQFTNLVFERYKYGPNETEVINCINELDADGIIKIIPYDNFYGGISYTHGISSTIDDKFDLAENEDLVASFIVDSLGNQSYRGVIDIAYSTPPMREILEEEKKTGSQFHGRVIDMSKSEPIFKSSREARIEARKRLSESKLQKGTDQQYYEHLLEQYHAFEDTRRRVNIAKQ